MILFDIEAALAHIAAQKPATVANPAKPANPLPAASPEPVLISGISGISEAGTLCAAHHGDLLAEPTTHCPACGSPSWWRAPSSPGWRCAYCEPRDRSRIEAHESLTLALGVREGIEASGTVPSRTTLHRALWRWCRQPEYLAAIADGRPRINLDGTDAGPVAPEHQAAAAAWLEKLRAKGERRAAAAASPEPAAAPVSEPAAPMPEPVPARPVLSLKKPLTKRKPT